MMPGLSSEGCGREQRRWRKSIPGRGRSPSNSIGQERGDMELKVGVGGIGHIRLMTQTGKIIKAEDATIGCLGFMLKSIVCHG